jgi:hypothetical protein
LARGIYNKKCKRDATGDTGDRAHSARTVFSISLYLSLKEERSYPDYPDATALKPAEL